MTTRRFIKRSLLIPSKYEISSLSINTTLIDGNLVGGEKQFDLIESDKKHHFEYQCEKTHNLIEASSQLKFFSFQLENQVGTLISKKSISFSALSKQEKQKCGEACSMQRIDCFFKDAHSFFFDYSPSTHLPFDAQQKKEYALMIETQFYCSEKIKNSLDSVDEFLIKKEETHQVQLEKLNQKCQAQEEEKVELKERIEKLETLLSKLLESKD